MKKTDEKLKKGMWHMGKKAIITELGKCNIHNVVGIKTTDLKTKN